MWGVEAISDWARRASNWADISVDDASDAEDETMGLIYRLRRWPAVPPSLRTLEVMRLLSMMSSRPVSHASILKQGKVKPKQLERLLLHLRQQDALEVINPASLPREPHADR